MKIILFQPQIPQNSGNVVRTCAVTGSKLVLVHPLGFSTKSRWLKRGGLDYWEGVDVEEIEELSSYLEQEQNPFFFFSSKAERSYLEAPFTSDATLIFGSETSGLPPFYFETYPDRFFKIPMRPTSRCLNLATSVGIALYEALRKTGTLSTESYFLNTERTKDKTTLMRSEEVNGR